VDRDRYEVLETYWRDLDIDESGIGAKVVTWSFVKTKKVMRATFLRRISVDGRVPYFKADFFRRKGQDTGIGIPEVLHPLSRELDAHHNQRVDFGTLTNMPFFFYRSGSSINPEKIELEPGMGIPVDNPQTDYSFPQMGNRTAWGFQEEASLFQFIQRFTGIDDLTLGVQTGQQGAARTARGVSALQQESSANIDAQFRRIVRPWKQSVSYLWHMIQTRIPEGLAFRVTGEDGQDYFAQVQSRAEIAGDFDFEISPNSANSNPAIKQQVARQILELTSNPLAIQLGVVTPLNFYEAQKNLALALGVKEHSKYLTKPAQFTIQLSPQEEFGRIINGMDVPVQPGQSDHEGYVKYFEFVTGSEELMGQLDQQQVLAAARQAQEHQRAMQVMQQLQAQQANAQQIRQNEGLGQGGSPGAGPSFEQDLAQGG